MRSLMASPASSDHSRRNTLRTRAAALGGSCTRAVVALVTALALTSCAGSLADPFDRPGVPAGDSATGQPTAADSAEPTATASVETTADTPSARPTGRVRAEVEVFEWGLPDGPKTPDGTFEDDFYELLARGQCQTVSDVLLGKRSLVTSTNPEVDWANLDSPRGVLLYYAGTQVCLGNLKQAKGWFDEAAAFGWRGVNWGDPPEGPPPPKFSWDCEVLRTVRSVLEQIERADVDCPGGVPLSWPDANRQVNPLTKEVVEIGILAGGQDTGSPSPSPSPVVTGSPSPSPNATASPTARQTPGAGS